MIKLRAGALLLTLFFLSACLPTRPTVTLALLGDLMVGRAVHPQPASLSYLASELKGADLRLANLESPLSFRLPALQPAYSLCASSERAGLLSAWGLDLLSIANNHSLDCGPDGLMGTGKALASAGLTPIGPGFQPVHREVNGLKLAFLAFDDISSPLDENLALQSIRSEQAEGALVIVSIHWGMEYQSGPSARQKALARQFAEAGAAVLVGTHPHVLQPAAWIQTARGRTLVLYSLGNALFDQAGLPDTRQSALVVLTLSAQGVQSMRVVPFEIDPAKSLIIPPEAQADRQIRARLELP
jgi:poly-gamma-glutamate capsule biosynthesis protein CapA/YwtB (metallophosphatase superfamily)